MHLHATNRVSNVGTYKSTIGCGRWDTEIIKKRGDHGSHWNTECGFIGLKGNGGLGTKNLPAVTAYVYHLM